LRRSYDAQFQTRTQTKQGNHENENWEEMDSVFGFHCVIVGLYAVFPGTTIATEKQKTIRWIVSSFWLRASALFKTDQHFCELASTLSGGKLKLSLHPVGELMGGMQQFEAAARYPAGQN